VLHHEILQQRACPVPSVHPFEGCFEVASECRDIDPWTRRPCSRIELMVLRCGRTEERGSCDAHRGTASALVHGDRLGDGRGDSP
jgi:hypothetical protein